ncbi:Fe2+-enterobactin ABC transporter substrate-binding protein [Pseudoalteromonas sp. CO302Y]|uniref:Fe2+-enterobactin ABC transporter substrate-binding protein n=1 Tax=unclassified Pseudoalteromonas TaxID=194690 RepID=UPI001022D4FD|nr:Fe2+-enterobactin ABC transporter substrate-binding protein [Pseudoalteromonas sp. CO302Y]RZG05937.1 Fe2+-enterobactin ABC transporter substrate-binding protein [Pseudoalteromonas sp. CO133X]
MIFKRFVNYCSILCVIFVTQVDAKQWPRKINNPDGSTITLPQAPKRILSTSVTVTGTLLALDAPIVASAATVTGSFFSQWQTVARQRNLINVWPAGTINIEAAYAVQPDLIIVSENGADSALAHVQLLKSIAPVMIVNYGDKDWQSLAVELAHAIGYEKQSQSLIDSFEKRIRDVKSHISLPAGTANVVSYNGAGLPNPIVTATGTHARLIKSLGFEIEDPEQSWHSGLQKSNDFVRAEFEHLVLLKSPTTFLIRAEQPTADRFMTDPVLANLNSVKSKQVYGLGANSFRIDYYSAKEILTNIERYFGNEK